MSPTVKQNLCQVMVSPRPQTALRYRKEVRQRDLKHPWDRRLIFGSQCYAAPHQRGHHSSKHRQQWSGESAIVFVDLREAVLKHQYLYDLICIYTIFCNILHILQFQWVELSRWRPSHCKTHTWWNEAGRRSYDPMKYAFPVPKLLLISTKAPSVAHYLPPSYPRWRFHSRNRPARVALQFSKQRIITWCRFTRTNRCLEWLFCWE